VEIVAKPPGGVIKELADRDRRRGAHPR
jgi:hypothetical protein